MTDARNEVTSEDDPYSDIHLEIVARTENEAWKKSDQQEEKVSCFPWRLKKMKDTQAEEEAPSFKQSRWHQFSLLSKFNRKKYDIAQEEDEQPLVDKRATRKNK